MKRIVLPTFFEINANIPLPDSVPGDYLVDTRASKTGKPSQADAQLALVNPRNGIDHHGFNQSESQTAESAIWYGINPWPVESQANARRTQPNTSVGQRGSIDIWTVGPTSASVNSSCRCDNFA